MYPIAQILNFVSLYFTKKADFEAEMERVLTFISINFLV